MRELLGSSSEVPVIPLPRRESSIIGAGWAVGPQGALLVAAAIGRGARTDIEPSEVGEYEYHVNDIDLQTADLRVEPETYLVNAATRGIIFAAEMLRAANGLPACKMLCGIVSVFVDVQDDLFSLQGVTVRFTTRRGGYPDWLGDLDRFEHHAVAVLDSADAGSAPLLWHSR